MKKVAVIIAPGFEEGEALTIVDILHTSITGISQHLSSIALSVQLSTKIGATFMSLTMIGNICTKLLIGF